jgi:hypothetical protein
MVGQGIPGGGRRAKALAGLVFLLAAAAVVLTVGLRAGTTGRSQANSLITRSRAGPRSPGCVPGGCVETRDGGGASGGSGAAATSLPVLALTAGLFLAGGLVLNVFRA